jgi:hypothetical protein
MFYVPVVLTFLFILAQNLLHIDLQAVLMETYHKAYSTQITSI